MLKKVTAILFLMMLIELTLGGGGRLTAIGPVSLRMVLFGLAVILTITHFFYRDVNMEKVQIKLLSVFTLMLVAGIITGVANGADLKFLWEDVKPLLFFYALPFFALAVNKREDVERMGKLITIAASTLAMVYFVVLTLIHSGIIKFLSFYHWVYPTDEFFFRGEIAFFYKGFLFLCIGFLFAHLFFEKKYWGLMSFLLVALILSFTRGFLLALALTYLYYYLVISRSYTKAVIVSLACITIVWAGKDIYTSLSLAINTTRSKTITLSKHPNTRLLGDREYSDTQRKLQAEQVISSITPTSVWVGHGFGKGIPSRPIHMEISYLEIFHKQGVFGLLCWGVLLVSFFNQYKLAAVVSPKWSAVFFLAGLLVVFQSLTNQYINNPIGLSVLMISLVSFQVIKSKAV
jgi:hypothetical protein